ncbi:MAG: tripartite tricarboxylate transporter substrate binding protein [Burkholderiaceae bacterium]
MRFSTLFTAAIFTIATANGLANAAEYPSETIRIVVPFPPGGTTDIVARAMSTQLTAKFNIPVVVDNRAGASGMIGTDSVARAKPDGYTLLMAGSPHSINNSLRKKVPYDPIKDFAPVALIGTVPMVLVVPNSLPVDDFKTFKQYAKDNPEALKCGVVPGAANHLATELFRSLSGVSMLVVPYKGDAPMFVDLIGQQINCVIGISTQVIGHISSGRLKALAVTSDKRLSLLPNVPTLQEAGMDGYEAGSWNGVFAPAGTPKERIEMLSDALVEATKVPSVKESFDRLGFQIRAERPERLAQFLDREISKWKKIIDDSNIQPQ